MAIKIQSGSIPPSVISTSETIKKAGFEAYLVGGCVRDTLLGKKPKDWDITTNANPEQIMALFPDHFYENKFGTVGVVFESTPLDVQGIPDLSLKVIEVTPYRIEEGYSDRRRPDSVTWSPNLEDDLKRRDFSINAIALDVDGEGNPIKLVDLYDGQSDLKKGLIKAVGDADKRFQEDALRMMRAVRLSSQLGFAIESETLASIQRNKALLSHVAKERIREEFERILMSEQPMTALLVAEKLGILHYFAPELEQSIGIEQNKAHSFDVWTHLLKSLQHAADKSWPLEIRIAALFHDIGKPATRRRDESKNEWTFYGHEVVGARMTQKILENLRFSNKIIEKVVILVRWHMFFSDTEQISLSAVRRMIRNVGQENIWDLMNLRICDRIGTGRPKESPYRLRKYHAMIEEALRAPISVGMLKINGAKIMEVTGDAPGPKIGFILHALLEETLEDPDKNTPEYLESRTLDLNKLTIEELKKKGGEGREKKEKAEEEALSEIRKKHWVE